MTILINRMILVPILCFHLFFPRDSKCFGNFERYNWQGIGRKVIETPSIVSPLVIKK